jgi:hypothetical protein
MWGAREGCENGRAAQTAFSPNPKKKDDAPFFSPIAAIARTGGVSAPAPRHALERGA